MVGNKFDRYEEGEITEEERNEFAKTINALFKFVSAKNGFGIDDLFETIANEYLKKIDNIEENKILSKLNKYLNF